MCRISALLLALLLACMPFALAESESLISQELIKADKVNYKTEAVETGAFERRASAAAEEYYPNTYNLSYDENGARFVSYSVIRGKEVKEGDVLAVFELESDAVELASLEMQLADAHEALENREADEEEDGMEYQRAILNAADAWEREMLTLQAQRAELALEQYRFSQSRVIAGLEKRIAEIEEHQAGNVLVAPADGVILGTAYKREGDKVYPGETLVTMYRTDGMLMVIENANDYFRYGMDVMLEVGPNKERVQLPGRVVGADDLLPEAERTCLAYVEVEIPEGVKLTRPIVSGATVSVENVSMVHRKAVSIDGGRYYVVLLVDGVPQKRFINCMTQNTVNYAWVYQGIEPDDEIIIE